MTSLKLMSKSIHNSHVLLLLAMQILRLKCALQLGQVEILRRLLLDSIHNGTVKSGTASHGWCGRKPCLCIGAVQRYGCSGYQLSVYKNHLRLLVLFFVLGSLGKLSLAHLFWVNELQATIILV